ncbi:MAG TPA: histidine kinase, partial [Chitinophagaceae bacterium]|nr:histidine kinase [Chitinophagaceae bacterium]
LATIRILLAALLNVLVHMGMVYSILYWVLPRYLSKNTNQVTTTAILLLVIGFFAFINYFNFIFSFYLSTRFQYFEKMPTMEFIIPIWSRMILFNYPTIIGFAIGIKLLKNWYVKRKEINQVAREKINIELELLKSQVHPHFLFNTLNNIYSYTQDTSPTASKLITRLSDLLRFVLYEGSRPLVPLDKELKMIQDYIALEKIRYGNKLDLNIRLPEKTNNLYIAPLLLLPLIENCFKHGTSNMLEQPWISLHITLDNTQMQMKLLNGKMNTPEERKYNTGIGIQNVKKRLDLVYAGKSSLTITNEEEVFIVNLKIELEQKKENELKIITAQEHSHA